MRPMSPVTVDYPHSLTNDTVPLTSSAATGRPFSPPESQLAYQQQQQARNMAIEDPYSSKPVMFSMIETKRSPPSQRYAEPTSPSSMSRHDIPMRGMNSMDSRSNTMSPPQRRYVDEDDYMDANPNMGYIPDHQQTTAPQRIRRPSWERRDEELTSPQLPGQPGDQIVRDWLWQSPDRRNT